MGFDETLRSFVSGARPAKSPRALRVGMKMGQSPQEMRRRISSVKKTAKITEAMRLVAAAKVRKAQDNCDMARPFSEELQGMIKGIIKKLKGSGIESTLPMLRSGEVKKVGLLVISSDKGLCGAYNKYQFNRASERMRELKEQGVQTTLVTVGRKMKARFTGSGAKDLQKELGYEVSKTFELSNDPGVKLANEVADEMKNLFLSGEVDKVEVIYAKFINLLKSEATLRTLLPLSPSAIDSAEDVAFRMTTVEGALKVEKTEGRSKVKAKDIEADMIFDQAPETILNSMLPLYLNSLILQALYEALASELGQRMSAMKGATDNAKNLAEKLSIEYNKARQARITQELLEVVNGAEAAKDTGVSAPTEDERVTELVSEFFDTNKDIKAAAPAPAAAKAAPAKEKAKAAA